MQTETFIKFFIVYTVGNHLLLKAICSKGFFVAIFFFFLVLGIFFDLIPHVFTDKRKKKKSLKAKAARLILERSLQNPNEPHLQSNCSNDIK